tara:strand:- start:110 stop:247 length:138 start_codon:yes stop_codon:yes gene_type:complete
MLVAGALDLYEERTDDLRVVESQAQKNQLNAGLDAGYGSPDLYEE